MKRTHFTLLLSLLLLFSSAPEAEVRAQAVFSWTDEAGVVHFTDDPGRVPEAYRASAMEERERRAARLTEETGVGAPVRKPEPDAAEALDAAEPEPEEDLSPLQQAVEETGADVDNHGHGKQYWQDRKRFWEHRLEVSKRLLDETRREFNLTNQRFDKREYKKMKELRERMRELEADVAQARDMLDGGLAEDARRAGAQPGWIR